MTGAGKYRSVSYDASKKGGNDIERQNVLFVIYEKKPWCFIFQNMKRNVEEYTKCCRKNKRYCIARWKLEYGKYEEVGEVEKGWCILCLERRVETRNWMI